ncbi:MAG: TldD/PmbA family protein [Propionibacteriaceae bacterium]|nr:TldD/PmbA family protein [Propionibacteriaceae bacterium]
MLVDETFRSLPLDRLADAALSAASALGASQADVRVMRLRNGERTLRDARLEASRDTTEIGLSVRVVHQGAWGFAAGITLTPDAAAEVARQAVQVAKVSRPLAKVPIELADEPVHVGEYVSSYERNPFEVPETERVGRLAELSQRLCASRGVSHVDSTVSYVQENTFFSNLAGTRTLQQRVRILPTFSVTAVHGRGFDTLRTVAPPVGRGWEYLNGTGWDFDAEIAELPDQLAELVSAPDVRAAHCDLVIDPTNLWLTIHESVAHATELDRALGYEAAYAGTSFATFDQLGSLRYGSELMHVTGDRVTEYGLATTGWDDEGVAAQSFDIIRDGVLVGYQLNRQMAAERGLGRSNGCAFADSAKRIPLQRMPNVSLRPLEEGPDTAELISRVEDGYYIVGDDSWSIDMQRYNFQFTGQRWYRIKGGRLAGMVKHGAYQATTTDFWRSMVGLGGPQTYLLAGALNCGKGQPGQVAAVSHGCPSALFTGVNVLNTEAEAGRA